MSRTVVDLCLITSMMDLHNAGHSHKEIAQLKGLSLQSVYLWIRHYQEGGSTSLPIPKSQSGRPGKISKRTLSVLHR